MTAKRRLIAYNSAEPLTHVRSTTVALHATNVLKTETAHSINRRQHHGTVQTTSCAANKHELFAARVANSFMQHLSQRRSCNEQGTYTMQKRQNSTCCTLCHDLHAWRERAIRKACMASGCYLLPHVPLPGCKHHCYAGLSTRTGEIPTVQKHTLSVCVPSSRLRFVQLNCTTALRHCSAMLHIWQAVAI